MKKLGLLLDQKKRYGEQTEGYKTHIGRPWEDEDDKGENYLSVNAATMFFSIYSTLSKTIR